MPSSTVALLGFRLYNDTTRFHNGDLLGPMAVSEPSRVVTVSMFSGSSTSQPSSGEDKDADNNDAMKKEESLGCHSIADGDDCDR